MSPKTLKFEIDFKVQGAMHSLRRAKAAPLIAVSTHIDEAIAIISSIPALLNASVDLKATKSVPQFNRTVWAAERAALRHAIDHNEPYKPSTEEMRHALSEGNAPAVFTSAHLNAGFGRAPSRHA